MYLNACCNSFEYLCYLISCLTRDFSANCDTLAINQGLQPIRFKCQEEKKSEVKLSYFPGLYEYRFTEENLTDYEAFVLELIVYLANSAKITKPLLCHLPGFIDFDVYTVITKTQTSKIEYIFFSIYIADMVFNHKSNTKVYSPVLPRKK